MDLPNITPSITLNSRKKYPVPAVGFEDVTPSQAAKWLASMDPSLPNRNVNKANKGKLVRAMVNGDFGLTGDSICIDPWGRLWNGQHRCGAIVESNTTQRLIVAYGLVDFIGQDIGTKRTVGGFLTKYAGFSKMEAKRAPARIKQYNDIISGLVNSAVSEVESLNLIKDHVDLLKWTAGKFKLDTGYQTSPIVAAFMVAYEADPSRTDKLATAYVEGTDLTAYSPIRQFRKWVEGQRISAGRKAMVRQTEYRNRALTAIAAEFQNKEQRIAPVPSEEARGYILDLRAKKLAAQAA
jgi:hypothetical protein